MTTWIRVSKKQPCLVCGKHDWCTFTEDASCCMRVQSKNVMMNGGWMHRHGDDVPKRKLEPIKEAPKLENIEGMFKKWSIMTNLEKLCVHADSLGVDWIALASIGTVWHHEKQAWAFPMKDADGKYIGIRLRRGDGFKFAVAGSRAGLFFNDYIIPGRLYVMEGPTDLAAAITIGLNSMARPSCLGCETMVDRFCRLNKISEAVIISDNDTPGLNGATKLQSYLGVRSTVFATPKKDLRDSVKAGLTKEQIEFAVSQRVWKQPKK